MGTNADSVVNSLVVVASVVNSVVFFSVVVLIVIVVAVVVGVEIIGSIFSSTLTIFTNLPSQHSSQK